MNFNWNDLLDQSVWPGKRSAQTYPEDYGLQMHLRLALVALLRSLCTKKQCNQQSFAGYILVETNKLDMLVWQRSMYHYGGPFPIPETYSEADSRPVREAVLNLTTNLKRQRTSSKYHFQVHFYLCPEWERKDEVGGDNILFEPNAVEEHTVDYRMDRRIAPVFQLLPRMPRSMQVFDRFAAQEYLDRRERASMARAATSAGRTQAGRRAVARTPAK